MANENYKMVTVYEYLDTLEKKVKYVDTRDMEIKETIKKYLLGIRRANTNAAKLDKLLT